MVQLVPGTPLFEELIADAKIPDQMTVVGPTYALIRNAFNDPAVREPFMDRALQHARQLKDIQVGVRYLLEGLVVFQPGRATGIPSTMLGGLKDVLRGADIPAALTSDEVIGRWMNATTPREVIGALLGTALAALGLAVPVVGTIAAAVVGLATAIYTAMETATIARDLGAEQRKALEYALFPPLIIPDSNSDATTVNNILRPRMASADWTPIFLPRYKGEWHGEERSGDASGGFAFAPGVANISHKYNGSEGESFVPFADDPADATLGCIPGTDTITGIVQVNLPHNPAERDTIARPFYDFLRGGTVDPRAIDASGIKGKTRVVDTGTFYPLAGRLAGSLWNWAGRPHNPLKFRIDTTRLAAWREYCEGGLEYIRKVVYPWAPEHLFNSDYTFTGKNADAEFFTYDPNANFEGYFGGAVFHAIGAFTCSRTGLESAPPSYKQHPPPFGLLGSELGVPGAYGQLNTGQYSGYSGPFLPIIDPRKWPDQCMGTRWDRGPLPIAVAIAQLHAAQWWDLRHSPQSVATCRMMDAAFLAPDMRLLDQLLQSRAILLQHEVRSELDLDDIPEDEPPVPGLPGESWRAQLQAAGVPKGHPFLSKKARAVRFGGSPGPVPPPPPAGFVGGNPDPWNPEPPPSRPKRKGRQDKPAGGGGVGAIVAGGVGLAFVLAAVVASTRRTRRAA